MSKKNSSVRLCSQTIWRATACLVALFIFTAAASAVTYTVDTTDDNAALTACTAAVNDCSLRGAITAANGTVAADTINFAIPVTDPNCPGGVCTITLTLGDLGVNAASTAGALTITNPTGASRLLISGNQTRRVLYVKAGADLTLNGLTVTKGNSRGTIDPNYDVRGGGILNLGTLALANCAVSGNLAAFAGGSFFLGGGVFNAFGGVLNLTNSTISANTATQGGGIYNAGTVTLTNSTVSGNMTSESGGGIYTGNNSIINLNSVTVTRNQSNTSGGGILNQVGTVNLSNTIVAKNTASVSAPDFSGAISATSSYNLIGNGANQSGITNGTNGNQIGTAISPIDPRLDPTLALNGGTTPNHALLAGSPALDAGSAAGTDQRGVLRPVDLPSVPNGAGNAADIGAYEAQTAPQTMGDVAVSITDSPDPAAAGANLTYTINLTNNAPEAALVVSLTDTLPANTTFVSLTQNAGALFSCTTPAVGGTGTVNCSAGSLASGASASFSLVVKVNRTTAAGTVLSDTVNVSTVPTDSNTANNSASTTTTVGAPAPLVVTRSDDRNNPTCVEGDCSLREAVNAANALSISESITFAIPPGDAGCTAGGVCTITLTLGELGVNAASTVGALTITNPTGASRLLISGNQTRRVFFVNAGADLTLDGLTVTRGNGRGTITTTYDDQGGGILNIGGTLTLINCAVSGNTAQVIGGGIFNRSGTLTLTNSTISGNTASQGGGIYNNTAAILNNSTISGNISSINGGGIWTGNNSILTLNSMTVTLNRASSIGGILNQVGTVTLRNTIIAGNINTGTTSNSPDFNGTVSASSAENLIGNGANQFGITNGTNNNQIGTAANPINPLLAPLANNGGATETHALLAGSPAIDKGYSYGFTTDQRGFFRLVDNPAIPNAPNGDGTDIGAFEVQLAPTAAAVSISGYVTTITGSGILNVRLTLTDASGQVRTATTTASGYYQFDDVQAGETYILLATGKRYTFSQPVQVLNVNEETTEVNFTANTEKRRLIF